MTTDTVRQQGFTLLETMIALVVLAVAALGALAGMMTASKELSASQARQYKTSLAEAHAQAYLFLANKQPLLASAVTVTPPSPEPDQIAVGPEATPPSPSLPWQLDPTTPQEVAPATTPPTFVDPMSAGAFFKVDALGHIVPIDTNVDSNVSAWTASRNCLSAPVGTFCREIAVTTGVEDTTVAPSGTAYTLWTRVTRVGDPPGSEVVHREVIVQ